MKIGTLSVSLWNIIRDFFVQYVWGGTTSNGVTYFCSAGKVFSANGENQWLTDLNGIPALNQNFLDTRGYAISGYYPLSEWLSTTSTILTLVIILVVIAYFIRFIFKVFSNSILLR